MSFLFVFMLFDGFFLLLLLCFDIGFVNVVMLLFMLLYGFWLGFWFGFGLCVGDFVYVVFVFVGMVVLL